tara:strand:- start:1107 stop:1388 length:282 start_codon:yes stop_codon:yes gene_type:complete
MTYNDPCTIALQEDKKLMAIHSQPASPNADDLDQLVDNYVNHIVEGLDVPSLEQMCIDLLTREYEKLTWDEVTEEIVDLYDEDTLIDLIPDAK